MSSYTIVGVLVLFAVLCANPADAVDARIVNGTTSSNYKYLYLASLRNLTNVHFCGGSILNTRWVLTAAQCLQNVTNFTVVVGTHNLTSGGITHQVATFKKHPLYNSTTSAYDVAVVKTLTAIKYSITVLPVTLSSVVPGVDTTSYIAGWGYTDYSTGAFSDSLKVVSTNLISTSECQDRFSKMNITIQPTQICTFSKQKGACVGDEGSPLTVANVQFGIVSLYSCGYTYPDIYTNIHSVYVWIWLNTYTSP